MMRYINLRFTLRYMKKGAGMLYWCVPSEKALTDPTGNQSKEINKNSHNFLIIALREN